MWIAACTCGTGITAESEAEAASLAEIHLLRAAVPGPGDTWQHAVSLGEATNACKLTPNWGADAPAALAPSTQASRPSGNGARTLSPADIMRQLKRQELQFSAEDEEFEEPKAPVRANPYTVDPDPGVDVGFRNEGAYREKPEDYSGWGGPGRPPENDDDEDYSYLSIDPVDAPTSLDELPEGIILGGQVGTGPKLPLVEDEYGPDYTLDTDTVKPVWPGDKRPEEG